MLERERWGVRSHRFSRSWGVCGQKWGGRVAAKKKTSTKKRRGEEYARGRQSNGE